MTSRRISREAIAVGEARQMTTHPEYISSSPTWSSDPTGMVKKMVATATRPARLIGKNLVDNVREDPKIFLAALASGAAIAGGSKAAMKVYTMAASLNAAGLLVSSMRNAKSFQRIIEGKPEDGDYDTAIRYLGDFLERSHLPASAKEAIRGSWYEGGLAEQKKPQGIIGLTLDAVQGVNGYRNHTAANKLAGIAEKPSIWPHLVEAGAGAAGILADKIPGLRRIIPNNKIGDVAAATIGGAAQNFASDQFTISPETAQSATEELERRRALYEEQMRRNRDQASRVGPLFPNQVPKINW